MYEIGPTGTTFKVPVAIAIHYAAIDVGQAAPQNLKVATFADGAWKALVGPTLDAATKTISGKTMHLSPYGAIAQVCAPIAATQGGCTSGGPTQGGAAPPCEPPPKPTCATATCGANPGAELTSCTDTADGYDALCCYPAGAPTCVAENAACAGSTPTGDTGGAPPCTCEAMNPCQYLPGSTQQSCTVPTNGSVSAVCCLPPGTPLPGTGDPGSGTDGAGSTSGGGTGGTGGGGTGGGGTGGVPDGGSGGGAVPCAADGSPTGSCDAPPEPLCWYFPNTTVTSCTNNPSGGYMATCCPVDAGK